MKSKTSELIWLGNIHLGDEPGVFSHACYSGLAFELPITVKRTDGEAADGDVALVLTTEFVKVFEGYAGHKVTVTEFVPDPSNQNTYKENILAEGYLTDSTKVTELPFELERGHTYLSCKLEIDTTVKPGLYDDFLFKRLDIKSENKKYYASLGFK
ncbi:MAG: hypothetical protein AAGI38_11645 [Bacteroidota bacterium]